MKIVEVGAKAMGILNDGPGTGSIVPSYIVCIEITFLTWRGWSHEVVALKFGTQNENVLVVGSNRAFFCVTTLFLVLKDVTSLFSSHPKSHLAIPGCCCIQCCIRIRTQKAFNLIVTWLELV